MLQTDLLVKALLAYSVHEHQLGNACSVSVWLAPEQIALQDDGRGMGLDRHGYVENLLGILVGHSSAVQLHGIGLSLVAAVTPLLVVESLRGDIAWRQSFEHGIAIEAPTRLASGHNKGTLITLTGLPPLTEAGVANVAAQSRVWQAANPGLAIVLHEHHRPRVTGSVA